MEATTTPEGRPCDLWLHVNPSSDAGCSQDALFQIHFVNNQVKYLAPLSLARPFGVFNLIICYDFWSLWTDFDFIQGRWMYIHAFFLMFIWKVGANVKYFDMKIKEYVKILGFW